MDAGDFGERYFEHDCGRPYQRDEYWLAFFNGIADAIASEIKPRRVLDAGCAMGFLVEALRQRGVEAYGFDLSSYALARASSAVRPYCWQASASDEIEGTYDLIVCLEVLPHLPLEQAERAAANFCRHTGDLLFSVHPYGPAPLHANTAPPEHWAGVFAAHGFQRDFTFDGRRITPYAVRYRRALCAWPELVELYERKLRALRQELNDERARAEFAEQTMRNMQGSLFWKARGVWQKARSLGASVTRRNGGTHV